MVTAYVTDMCHVRQYLQVIRDVDIYLNLEKCNFGKPEVKLVGHIYPRNCEMFSAL